MNEWKPGVPKASQANNNNENTWIMEKNQPPPVCYNQNPWWWNHHWWRIWIYFLPCLLAWIHLASDTGIFSTQRESFQKNCFHKAFFAMNRICQTKELFFEILKSGKKTMVFFQCVILINYFFGHRFSSINDQMINPDNFYTQRDRQKQTNKQKPIGISRNK